MNWIYRYTVIIIFSFGLLVQSARAGGLWLYEGGTPDLGTAGAGRAALAACGVGFC